LKWAFRVKPDLVITDGKNGAVCVEAKLTSGESSYPLTAAERAIWGSPTVTQREVQRFMMRVASQFRCKSVTGGGS
jgi:hypothetical protein